MNKPTNSGFTLIELLITIVITGLLVAIATGKYKGVREKAYDVAAVEEIKNLTVMAEAYFADNLIYPDSETDINYTPPPGIALTRFQGDVNSIHIHLNHASSSNYFHINYPEDQIEKRKI